MASRVYLHVGLPKTGTTYLQSVLWANKPKLREQGILLPGNRPRDHMWATVVLREHPSLDGRAPQAATSWDRIVEQVRAHPGTAVISHEFFGAATEEQAARALADLDAEVHLVVTARDVMTIVASYWQEYLKHGWADLTLDEFPRAGEPYEEWSWRTLDLPEVIRRWAGNLLPEQVHVLVVPGPDQPRDALWTEFADLIGIRDAAGFDLGKARENSSLAVVEAEFMREMCDGLGGFSNALDRGVWLRGYLAHQLLVPRKGDRPRPSDARIAELRAKGDATVAWLAASGFDIRGDLERLRVPEVVGGREPATVTGDEVRHVAMVVVRRVLTRLRDVSKENRRLEAEVAELRAALEAAGGGAGESADQAADDAAPSAPAQRRRWFKG